MRWSGTKPKSWGRLTRPSASWTRAFADRQNRSFQGEILADLQPDQRIDAINQASAIHRRLPVGMLQPDRLIEQQVASRGHTDRLHLVEERRVGSILQRQEMGDEARAVFGVPA